MKNLRAFLQFYFKYYVLFIIIICGKVHLCQAADENVCRNLIVSSNSDLRFVEIPNKRVSAKVGKPKTLHCCAEGYTTVEWYANGIEINNEQGSVTTFTLNSVESNGIAIKSEGVNKNDYGNYTCIFRNDTKSIQATIQLVSEMKIYNGEGRDADYTDILLLLEKPNDPLFMPKGDNVVFNIPTTYMNERCQNLSYEYTSQFAEKANEVVDIQEMPPPDISIPMQLSRHEVFSLGTPLKRHSVKILIGLFTGTCTYEEFLSIAAYCRDRVNPMLFNYALTIAILHHPELSNLQHVPLAKIFPERFIDHSIFARIREEAAISDAKERVPVVIPVQFTASDLEPEHRVAYFREDIGINQHHWNFHLVYAPISKFEIVNKDRRGELFYFVHHQMQARYNFDRLCNHLTRTRRLLNWREPIDEGYFPKLSSQVAGNIWAARQSGSTLKDFNRDGEQYDIQDLEQWRDHIYEAIHKGKVIDEKGDTITLTKDTGIDILGNIVEATMLSPNERLYGNLHNCLHDIIAYCHDPDKRYLEGPGVMGATETTMRDPAFYLLHSFVDDLFDKYKKTLPPYIEEELDYKGVTVTNVEITSKGCEEKNKFITYWKQDDVDVAAGLDFTVNGSVYARFTHLQYSLFKYKIQVNNYNNSTRKGTVRIFLAPKLDETGKHFTFNEQRLLFIELDKFTVELKPGINIILRCSTQSSVTIPFEKMFPTNKTVGDSECEKLNYPGCGWPQYMLLPKGTVDGMKSQLFVMVSNYDHDKVDGKNLGDICGPSSFCGVRNGKYPDKRPMGYPFDRLPRRKKIIRNEKYCYDEEIVKEESIDTLKKFLTPNMYVQNVKIYFENRVEGPSQL